MTRKHMKAVAETLGQVLSELDATPSEVQGAARTFVMSNHTPGPWTVKGGSSCRYIDAGDTRVAVLDMDYCDPGDMEAIAALEADALLIAAAPELLALARAVLLFHSASPWDKAKAGEWHDLLTLILGGDGTGKTAPEATTKMLCDAARAAIAKATEGEP